MHLGVGSGITSWGTTGSAWHTTGHTSSATGATSSLVDTNHDRVEFGFKLLLFSLESTSILRVSLYELESFSNGVLDYLLVLVGEVVLQLLFVESVLNREAVVLKSVLGLDLLTDGIILNFELVGVSYHLLDLLLGETTLIVSDGDLLGFPGCLVASRHVQDTVGIDVEGDLDLGGTTGSGRDTTEVELTEEMVVLSHLTLALEDLDENTWLVVSVGSEGLLLLGGDGSVPRNKHSHDSTRGLDTLGKRGNIDEEEILDLLGTFTGEDGSLDGSTVSDGLVRVDGSVELLTVEELSEHLLNLGDSG